MIKNRTLYKIIVTATSILLFITTMCGCDKTKEDAKWNSNCIVKVSNMPDEFNSLPQSIANEFNIKIELKSIANDREYTVNLNKDNDFSQDVNVLPGNYSVEGLFVNRNNYVMINVEPDISQFSISADNTQDICLMVTNTQEFITNIKSIKPTDKIINADKFSRLVQYKGQIIDISEIDNYAKFEEKDTTLLAGEECYLQSIDDSGIVKILKNTTSDKINAMDADFIGVSFDKNNVVFPGGYTIGTSVSDVANKENGILGYPSYCLGSPFIGMDIDWSSVVYVDMNTGDRITLNLTTSNANIYKVVYEFEMYQ